MPMPIRPFTPDDMEDVVQLSLAAWASVYHSFEQVLGSKTYSLLFPDWRATQRTIVEKLCRGHAHTYVWVDETQEGRIAGFVAYTLDSRENGQEHTAEVELLAVHPEYQNRGIGTALTRFALEKMQEGGIKLAVVATGGDAGHAPARRAYEKAGFTALPGVRYYRAL